MRLEQDRRSDLSASTKRLALLTSLATAVVCSMVFAVLPPVLPQIAQHFGGGRAGEFSAQFALTLPALGWLLGGLLAGPLVHRAGLRRALPVSLALIGLVGFSGVFAGGLLGFAATRLILGFAGVVALTCALTLLAGTYDEQERPKAIGYLKAVHAAAGLPIGLATGLLASAGGWKTAFGSYLIAGLLTAALAWAALTHTRVAAPDRSPRTSASRATFLRVWPLLLMIVGLNVPMTMVMTQLPFVFAEDGLTDVRLTSLFLSSAGLVISGSVLLSGHLQARFGGWPVLLAGIAISAVGYTIVGFSSDWRITVAGNALGLVGGGFYYPQYYTLPLARVAPAAHPEAIGLAQSASYLGTFATPLLVAPIHQQLGAGAVYLVVAAALAAGVLITLITGATYMRRPARAAR